MPWEIRKDRPIYSQLLEHIEGMIISGEFMPGERIPSVRELAAMAAVNPNTMQRTMMELENKGLIVTNRTSGRMVTEDIASIEAIKNSKGQEETEGYLTKMNNLGFNEANIIQLIKEGIKK